MHSTKILALGLIVLGIVVLAYSGITFKTPGKTVAIGPVQVGTTQTHFIPPVAGAIALAAGIVLWIVGSKNG